MILTNRQQIGLTELLGNDNIFLTGGAGTGKSTLVREWISMEKRFHAITASTGVAAVLINGMTFHSFFGLPPWQGDPDKMASAALKKPLELLRSSNAFIVDEVSMIDGNLFTAADKVAKAIKGNKLPFGGMRVVVVGDFFQLPPVKKTMWAFESKSWQNCDFLHINLTEYVRQEDSEFLQILSDVRTGQCSSDVNKFLNSRLTLSVCDTIPRVHSRNVDVDKFNKSKLDKLTTGLVKMRTEYTGYEEVRDKFPIPPVLELRPGALVMVRRNGIDCNGNNYVNGTIGTFVSEGVIDTADTRLYLDKVRFEYRNGNGKIVATATNYPLSLAWATTIHKSQGATLDSGLLDLSNLWEPGQAYVALSRIKTPDGVFISAWDKQSIMADPKVINYYKDI
jgi:ATP-dependent DNA helicase PIF1